MLNNFEFLAKMASENYQKRWVENSSVGEGYCIPEEILDQAIGGLRQVILSPVHVKIRERVLNLYVYCCIELDHEKNIDVYNTIAWVNIRTAIKNFLEELTTFNLAEWEHREVAD
jgi:hypothetical protein